MADAPHFDQLETRDPEQRELAQFNLLPDLIRQATATAPGWADHLKGVDPAAVTSREALAKLPVLRKSGLHVLQARRPPFGGFATTPLTEVARVFHVARADLRARGPRRGLVAGGTRALRGGCAQGRHRAQHLRLSPYAGRLDPGFRRARAGLCRGRGRPGQHRAADRGDPGAAGLQFTWACRTYLKILLDKAREAGKDAHVVQEGRRSAAARCFPRCGPSTSSAASPPSRPMRPPISASSPTRARRWTA